MYCIDEYSENIFGKWFVSTPSVTMKSVGGPMQPNPEKIVVYTKVPCGYCSAAIRYLQSIKGLQDIEVVDLTGQYDALRELMSMSQQRTVPQIYIYGQHVGGYDDLRQRCYWHHR